MTNVKHAANSVTCVEVPWRGIVAFALLAVVGALGPDITASRYWELDHYILRYIMLAFSVGFALSAIRTGRRVDRVFGIAVIVTGGGLVAYIIYDCLCILSR